MSSLLDELLGYALNIGLSEDNFWTMTIPEINRRIKAWNWQENRQHQFLASMAYRLPQLISIAVLDGKNYPEIYDAFPNEFDETTIKEQQKKIQIQKDIATFQAWAESFNARQRKE